MPTSESKTRNSLLVDALQKESMKVHVEFIDDESDLRPKYIYEAPADTKHGNECLVTVFVYLGDSSSAMYSVERKSTWNGAWDTEAQAIAAGLDYTTEV